MSRRRSNEDLLEESLGLKHTFLSQVRFGERVFTVIGLYATVTFLADVPSGVTIFVAVLFALVTKFLESHRL